MRRATWCVVVSMISGCAPVSRVANMDSTHERIVCFGNSLTEGFGAAPGHDFPSQLAALLERPVINAGRSGDTAALGLLRLEEDVLRHEPLLVVVEFGGNDAMQGIPAPAFEQSLTAIVTRIQDAGAMVVLAGIPSHPLSAQEYRDVYRRVARRLRAALIPNILAGILTDPTLRSDTIHPNERGYARMAQRAFRTIQPLLHEHAKRRARR